MAVAALVAVVVRAHAFPHYSGNHDEPVYVLQARALLDGHLTLPVYDHLRFFQPWLTGVVDGRLVFEFLPGWPAFLAVTQRLTGSSVPALPVVAALAVLGMYLLAGEAAAGEVRSGGPSRRAVAGVAAAATALTPMVVIQSGMLVSYLFTLALGTFAGAALLRGARTGAARPLVLGGLTLGAVLLTRPLDALLWGLPFVVAVVVAAWHPPEGGRAGLREAGRRLGWLALGVAPPALSTLVLNTVVTGRPTRFPIEAADPLNRFGFGDRRIMRGTDLIAYSGHDALTAIGDNFRHAPPWVLGSYLGIALALAGAWIARRRASTYVLLGLVVTFTVGYTFYWGLALMGAGAPLTGPQYYLPMLAPIVVLGATALVAAWRWRAWVAVVLAVAVVTVSAPAIDDKVRVNREFASAWADVKTALDRFDATDALVFVPVIDRQYLLSGPPFAANPPDLSGDRLYAADVAPDLVGLVASTTRTPYRVVTTRTDGPDGPVARTRVQRLRVIDGGTLAVRLHVVNPVDADVVTVYLATPSGLQATVLDRSSAQGATYDVEWLVAAPAAAAPDALAMPVGTAWLTAGVRFGAEAADPRAVEGAAAITELRWATRTTVEVITAVRPARRFGRFETAGFGPVMLETTRDGAVRGGIRRA